MVPNNMDALEWLRKHLGAGGEHRPARRSAHSSAIGEPVKACSTCRRPAASWSASTVFSRSSSGPADSTIMTVGASAPTAGTPAREGHDGRS
jgi:hypothetical protein